AVVAVFVHDTNIHNCPASDIWGAPEESKADCLTHIPVINVTRECGDQLKEAMAKGPVTVRMESTVVNEWRENCPILQADLKAEGTDKFVLFSGHIDSWDLGAMDNGSANATQVECAKLLAEVKDQLKRGLRVCFWSGHSQGKYAGSAWYADHHFEELEENCVAHVNIDSVGGMNAVVVEEAPVIPSTHKLAAEAVETVCGVKFVGKKIARNSDQSFLGIGIPSVFGTFSEQDVNATKDAITFKSGSTSRAGGLGWWWHTEHDTLDKLDPALLERDCKVYLYTLLRLTADNALPLCLKDSVLDMEQTVSHLQQLCADRFDFTPLQQRLQALLPLAQALDEKAAACKDCPGEIDRLVRIQMRASQSITRLTFHEANIYDFDRCGAIYPIPALAAGERLALTCPGSSRYYMAQTELMRGYNLVMGQLRDLIRYLQHHK
ncbi:MAG: M28 family peptidase, partial [Firmicutes bacterium]|nr:M28 family peptidase [Bacillota bacterium]